MYPLKIIKMKIEIWYALGSYNKNFKRRVDLKIGKLSIIVEAGWRLYERLNFLYTV